MTDELINDQAAERRTSVQPWLLCDYGQVLSLSQPVDDELAVADAAELDLETLRTRYWSERDAYDRADLSGRAFWESVCGRALSAERLAQLVALDVASWTHLSAASIAAVGRARRRGYRLALLSNAPLEIARALEHLPFLERFDICVFSCDVGEIKPARGIYEAAFRALGSVATEVTFFDDKAANVEGARALGIAAEQFVDPKQFDTLPDPRHARGTVAPPE